MLRIIVGADTNPGGRRYNEDRVAHEQFTSRGGWRLDVALLCDGVGGEERGERAAQLGIDTCLAYLRQGEAEDPARLLVNAVKAANAAVYAEASRLGQTGRMAATLVGAMVVNGEKLYIANAGDAKLYLYRDGKLVQLTRDHNFANVMVWLEKLTPEAAASHPEANKVMRALGIRDTLQVDVGVYETTTDYAEANRRGREGYPLKEGDAVLLCSDGLIKPTPATKQTLISEAEIIRVLRAEEGERAARALMGIALGRIPVGEEVDNISVVVLQTEDPARAAYLASLLQERELKQQHDQRRKVVIAAALVAVPLLALLLVTLAAFAGFFAIVRRNVAATNAQLAEATAIAAAQTQTVAAYTPTPRPTETPAPTDTPVPTRVPTAAPGEVAKVFAGETALGVITDDRRELIEAPAGESRYVAVTYLRYNPPDAGIAEDGNIHLQGGSQMQFAAVTSNKFHFLVLPGSRLLVWTGPYPGGVEIGLGTSAAVVAGRGCLAVQLLTETQARASCLAGECSYSTAIGEAWTPFAAGSELVLDLAGEAPPSTGPVREADYPQYWDLLNTTSAGRQDQARCGLPNFAATATLAAEQSTAVAARRTPTAATPGTPATPTATPSRTEAASSNDSGDSEEPEGPGEAPATAAPVVPSVTSTNAPAQPSATRTSEPAPATATRTQTVPPATATPSHTPVPPTATLTNTPVTPATPTDTFTVPAPTDTASPEPTATQTPSPVPPTATDTAIEPTATNTTVAPFLPGQVRSVKSEQQARMGLAHTGLLLRTFRDRCC